LTNNDGKNALHFGSQESIVKILIDAKCDLCCRTKDNKTPLLVHWEKGNGAICNTLLRHGANLDENMNFPKPFLYFSGGSFLFFDLSNFHKISPHPITVEFFCKSSSK